MTLRRTEHSLSEGEGPRLSKYIRSPGHKSCKVCVMPYRKHEHRVRRGDGGGGGWRKSVMSSDIGRDFLIKSPEARGYHRVYLYDEHRCAATVPLGAQGLNLIHFKSSRKSS